MAAKVGDIALKLGLSLVKKGNGLVQSATPRLQTFWYYAKTELRPPSFREMPQVQEEINVLVRTVKSGSWKQLTIKEAGLNVLVGAEIMFCFFIGEIIGRGSVVGYYIPGAVHYSAEF